MVRSGLGLITVAYRKYLLPGPFFTSDRITQSYSLQVSYYLAGNWSTAKDPALENYHDFIHSGNVTNMYRSRLDRYFYYQYIIERYKNPQSQADEQLKKLTKYYVDHYAPENADSVKFIFLRKNVNDFKVETDTLYSIITSCQ
jgi:hypothetical protein